MFTQKIVVVGMVLVGIGVGTAAAQKVYWADNPEWSTYNHEIKRANLDGTDAEVLVGGLHEIDGLAVDLSNLKIYWIQGVAEKIQRADLDGSNVEDIITHPASDDARKIVLDVAGGKMYWGIHSDFSLEVDMIRRANLDGTGIEDVVEVGGFATLRDIAVDPQGGKLYWTTGRLGWIKRADLDGSNAEYLLAGLPFTGTLALDIPAGKMYWASVKYSPFRIELRRANLDGTDAETVLPESEELTLRGLAVDSDAGKIYWSDNGFVVTDTIRRANLDGSNVEGVETGALEPGSLALDLRPPPAILRNRYISFDPNNGATPVAFEVTLPAAAANGSTCWVGEPCLRTDSNLVDPQWIADCVESPAGDGSDMVRDWSSYTDPATGDPVVYLRGCVIYPGQTYAVRTMELGGVFSDPTNYDTVPTPTISGSWADVVGTFDTSANKWNPPNGATNFLDINASIQAFQQRGTAPVSWIDVAGESETGEPNYIVNWSDIAAIVGGFQGVDYWDSQRNRAGIDDCVIPSTQSYCP